MRGKSGIVTTNEQDRDKDNEVTEDVQPRPVRVPRKCQKNTNLENLSQDIDL